MATSQFDQSSEPVTESDALTQTTPVTESSSPPTSTPEPIKPAKKFSLKPLKRFWGWQFLWLIILLGFGTTGAGALLWLLTMPPVPDCEEISPLSPDGERLYCADQAAKSGDLDKVQAAFALVDSWPSDHPLQTYANQRMRQWSASLIAIANKKIEVGDLEGALKIVEIVPKNTPAYRDVELAIAGWKMNWDEGQQLYDKALNALQALDWRKAFEYTQSLAKLNNTHWSEKRFNELVNRLAQEKQGSQRLEEAKDLAKEDTPEKLAEAIALAHQVNSKLYVYKAAQKEIENWSRTLLDQATQELKNKNLEGLIEIAQLVPNYSPLYAEAQDLILLGQVESVTQNQSMGQPLFEQIVVLLEGKAALEQIDAERPLYDEAQAQLQQLSAQVQDLVNLQFANVIASVKHPWGLQLAIDQAQMISPDRPRRIHAQTLVAHWRQEVERLEDQPYLALARRLAKTENIDGFKAAVQQASQVSLGRPLRIEAQTLIAEWTKRIQIIEDQPLFNEALELAKAGNLSGAIDKASKIKEGRALHKQAREKVAGWVAQIQIAEDRPILNRAYTLAQQGSLSAAIAEASRIGYGRALYSEAQGSIAQWAAERDAIWASQQRSTVSERASQPAQSSSYSDSASYSSYSEPSYSNNTYSDYSGSSNSGYSNYDAGYSDYSDSSNSGYSDSGGYSDNGGYSDYSSGNSGYSDSSGYSGDSGYSDYSDYSSSPAVSVPAEPEPEPAPAPAPEPQVEAAPAPSFEGAPPEENLFLE